MATPQGDVIALTGNLGIDYLVQGSAWQLGADRVLTYSLDQNFDGPSQDWDSAWASAVAAGFAAWEAVANIDFLRVGGLNGQAQNESTADLAISLSPEPGGAFAGVAIFPDPAIADEFLASLGYSRSEGNFPFPRPEGDITYNPALFAGELLGPGSDAFEVILHEIGHALGLKHLQDDGGNGRPVTGNTSNYRSVMSTNLLQDYTALGSPTVSDIAAIQHVYGPNLSYHTGDDAYSIDTPYEWVIWDTGGEDSLVAGAARHGYYLDLRPGVSSNGGGGDVTIYFNVQIEHAIGGVSHDTIVGNDVANVLRGQGGIDDVSGGNGADTILGGSGDDSIDGGAQADRLAGGDGSDEIEGAAGDDSLDGGNGADTLIGGAGRDTLAGGPGNDVYWLAGGDLILDAAGIDLVRVDVSYALAPGLENLSLFARLSAETIEGRGNALANLITSYNGDNVLTGVGGADTLVGLGGSETLRGGAGIDSLDGGGGDDVLYGSDGLDRLAGGGDDDLYILDQPGDKLVEKNDLDFGGDDTVRASFSIELPQGFEVLELVGDASARGTGNDLSNVITGNDGANVLAGLVGNDFLSGGAGHDLLKGGSAADVLYGGNGSDTLDGGAGFDRMVGGRGDDVYIVDAALPEFAFVVSGERGTYLAELYNDRQTYVTGETGDFDVYLTQDRTGDLLVDRLIVRYTAPGHSVMFEVRTDQLGNNLAPGVYTDVEVAGFADPGQAGLHIWELGARWLSGELEIIAAEFDYSGAQPELLNFAATFRYHHEDDVGLTWGAIAYDHGGILENVDEEAGQGTDRVEASISAELPDNVENLTLTGAGAIDGRGNGLDNMLVGNDAANELAGEDGNDHLTGGGGADVFVFDGALDQDGNVDEIGDFSPTDDAIRLDAAVFSALTGPGAVLEGEFLASADGLAADGDDRILYNTATGALYYDADGSGGQDAVQFALLAGAPAIDRSDLRVG